MTGQQQNLLSAFYKLCRERDYVSTFPKQIKESQIMQFTEFNGCCGYPLDMFIHAISSIDNYWREIQAKKND